MFFSKGMTHTESSRRQAKNRRRHPHPALLALLCTGIVVAGAISSPSPEATATPPADLVVDQPWDDEAGWVSSGPGQATVTDGHLSLTSGDADDVTRTQLSDLDVPDSYSFRTRVGVEHYGSENGAAVYDGTHRLQLFFRAEGIVVNDAITGKLPLVQWDADLATHDVRVDSVEGQSRLFLDGVDRGSFALEPDTGGDRIENWVKGPDEARLRVDHTTLSTFTPPRGRSTVLDEPLLDLSTWNITRGTATTEGDETRISADASLRRRAAVPDKYVATWTQDSTEGSHEVRIGNGKQALHLRTDRSGLSVQDQEDNWIDVAPAGSTRRQVTATVDKGFAILQVDGGRASRQIGLPDSQLLGVRIDTDASADVRIGSLRLLNTNDEPSSSATFSDSFDQETSGSAPKNWVESDPADSRTYDRGNWSIANHGRSQVLQGDRVSEPTQALLPALGRDLSISMNIRLRDVKADGQVQVLARRSGANSYVAATYDAPTRRWSLSEQEFADEPAVTRAQSKPAPLSARWTTVRLEVVRNRASLFVGDSPKPILESDSIHRRGLGYAGIQTTNQSVEVDDVTYAGENAPTKGMSSVTGFDFDNASKVFRLSDNTLVTPVDGDYVWESTDDGASWHKVARSERYEHFAALGTVLDDGTVLMAEHVSGTAENTYQHRMWRSSDDGRTWTGPFTVNKEWKNRITMGGKLMQTASGRIFFPSGESGHAQEEFGGVWIYYSDDDGRTWQESKTRLDWETFGINLQETSIVELSDGTLKAISRSDDGHLMESVSEDEGLTWTRPSNIAYLNTSLCAFGVEKDPVTGAIYLFWEYVDPADSGTAAQMPRNRASLAVSYDDTVSWSLLADVDDYMVDGTRDNHHMNQSLSVDGGTLWLNAARGRGKLPMRLWKVDLAEVGRGSELPGTHDLVSYR